VEKSKHFQYGQGLAHYQEKGLASILKHDDTAFLKEKSRHDQDNS